MTSPHADWTIDLSHGPPVGLVVEVRDASGPFTGGWAIVTLPMTEKNAYNVLLGPADERGRIEATWSDVLADCDLERSYAAMDYIDPRRGWTGAVDAVAMDADAVDRALGAYRLFNTPEMYPRGFEAGMVDLARRLAEQRPRDLAAEARVTFDNADWDMTDVAALLDEYRATAIAWDQAQGDPEKANPLFNRLQQLHKQLRAEPDGRLGIQALMAHPSVGVRLTAAAHSLQWSPEEAANALQAIEAGPGLEAVSAEYTLKAYRDGTLNLDW